LQARLRGDDEPPTLDPLDVDIGAEGATIEVDYRLGSAAWLWDEFDPSVYALETELITTRRNMACGKWAWPAPN
jgi:hypothetical protein